LDFATEIIPLTEGNVNVFDLDRVQFNILKALQGFSPEDCLVLNGPIILNFMAAKVLYENFTVDETHLLLWDAVNRQYLRKDLK